MILRLELLRLLRSRRPLIALGSLVFFLGMMLLGFYTYAESQGSAEFRYTFENESYFNGITFSLYAFYFGFLLILPVFSAAESGAQLAGDHATGRLALFLTRPVSRSKVFLVKLALMFSLSTGLVASLIALSLGIGLAFIGWGDLDLYPGVLQMTEGRQHLSQDQALWAFFMVWPAASLALFTALAFSVLISSWSRSGVNAVGASVAAYMILYVISEVHFFEELRPWLFTSHMSYWRGLFREQVDWPELLRHAARLMGFACFFLGLAFHRFRTKEEL